MQLLDYLVLVGYFAVMIAIGIYSSRMIKAQEDFFMGGRSFGKLLQTFAAFGAGTGSSDPVNTGRTTFTNGMSGMWSVMYWLFVTPFYWIAGVWYRRMRHLTLGDWFVERYESQAMGAAYCVFGLTFFMVYGSMLFSAIGKVAAPLVEIESVSLFGQDYGIEYLLVPIIGVVVLVYGIMGGLRAAYFTDLIQGLCIILLSVLLVPYGLQALVEKFGNPETDSLMAGFRYMHQQLPKEHFDVIGSTTGSEFPIQRIIAVVIINLIGIVVQPHFIATGGGSAKTETNARVGLVVGNFLKRFCTVGWVLTALIALALFADNRELMLDPDKTWGVASRELLGPGLTGLMLACLLAALMSSVDAYMIVGSGLMVRNVYAPYVNPNATEATYIKVARMTGVLVVAGSVIISLFYMNVFQQLQLTWVFPVLFAAPFWVGMYWRKATRAAAWMTVAFCTCTFFLIPFLAPRIAPSLRTAPRFLVTNQIVQTTTVRDAAPSDVHKRETQIAVWEEAYNTLSPRLQVAEQAYDEANAVAAGGDEPSQSTQDLKQLKLTLDELVATKLAAKELGARPEALAPGDTFSSTTISGGHGVFWPGGVKPVSAPGGQAIDVQPKQVGQPVTIDEKTEQIVLAYGKDVQLEGSGNFRLDFLLYQIVGVDFSKMANSTLATMELPPKIITPFLVMILFSLVTKPNSKEALDRYYSKMKTPVVPDHEADLRNLEEAYKNVEALEERKLFPGSSLEIQKPTQADWIGFLVCFATCFAIIGLAVWMANIGG
ncbi:MAG TPA: sodium:solute symporter family protein [Pirellulaceae bacterium]|nr:sodium:solute symporter family protein [Pirellulaceae bacterium]